MNKHTPAAILGAYTGITIGPFSDIHEYISSLHGYQGITQIGLAQMDFEHLRKSIKSNGDFDRAVRMVEALPDLLEACKLQLAAIATLATRVVGHDPSYSIKKSEEWRAIDAAYAAIAKAEGGAK